MPRCLPASVLPLGAVLVVACAPAGRDTAKTEQVPNVVHIVARGLTFEAPDSIPSGWNRFRFTNESEVVHFAVLERLPAGVTIKEQQEQAAPVFQEGMRLFDAGQPDSALAAFGKLPEWFGQVVFSGGPGLTSPGQTSETTLYLEPGTYLIECYVKTAGVFHSYNPNPPVYGMVRQVTVTGAASREPEPSGSIRITLSTGRGIEIAGDPQAGPQTVAVYFEDQKIHENFAGHDLQLVRLSADTDLPALAAWMDWTRPGGLQTPSPAQFLGGAEEMPAGSTAYLTVDLTPGRYAWISEVPNPDQKGMLVEFSVPPSSGL